MFGGASQGMDQAGSVPTSIAVTCSLNINMPTISMFFGILSRLIPYVEVRHGTCHSCLAPGRLHAGALVQDGGGGFNGLITLVARALVQCRQARAPLAERSRSQRRPSRWSVRFDSAQRTVGWMDRPAGLGRPIIPTHLQHGGSSPVRYDPLPGLEYIYLTEVSDALQTRLRRL